MSNQVTAAEIDELVRSGSALDLRVMIDTLITEKRDIEAQLAAQPKEQRETNEGHSWRAKAIAAIKHREQGLARLRRRYAEVAEVQRVLFLQGKGAEVTAELQRLVDTDAIDAIDAIAAYDGGLIVVVKVRV